MVKFRILIFAGMMALFLVACGGRTASSPTPVVSAGPDLVGTSMAEQILERQSTHAAATTTAKIQKTLLVSRETPSTASGQMDPQKPVSPTLTPITVFATTAKLPAPGSIFPPTSTPTRIPSIEGGNLNLPSPTPYAPAEGLLFADDFSSKNGWYVEKLHRYALEFINGGYRISVNTTIAPVWSVRLTSYEDVRIESDAVQQSGPADGFYGLVCRYNEVGNYYMLVVSVEGNFGIAKVKGSEIRYLNYANQENNRIRLTGNRLRADCTGDTLALYVDGEKVLEATDGEFSSGNVGLVVGNRSKPGTTVMFDNFVVIQP